MVVPIITTAARGGAAIARGTAKRKAANNTARRRLQSSEGHKISNVRLSYKNTVREKDTARRQALTQKQEDAKKKRSFTDKILGGSSDTTHSISLLGIIVFVALALAIDTLQMILKVLWFTVILGTVSWGMSGLLSLFFIGSFYIYLKRKEGSIAPITLIVVAVLEFAPFFNMAFGLTFWAIRAIAASHAQDKRQEGENTLSLRIGKKKKKGIIGKLSPV